MGNHRKTWTKKQKLEIVLHYKEHGIARTSRQYEVNSNMVYKWNKIYESKGASGLEARQGKLGDHELEILRLKRENEQLKAIVAEKELALRIKTALLKKSE